MLSKKNAMKRLGIWIVVFLFLIVAIVYIFDPFYQYHEPIPGMKRVLNDRDYQVVGTIRNFEYDSVILGSSVAENFDGDYFDEQFNCSSIKIVRASSSTADLLYYLQMAHEKRDLKNVLWCMDNFALIDSDEITHNENKALQYLYTDTILDDEEYLFNKDVLMMKIPLTIAYSVLGINTDGAAYDWSRDKEFSASKAMRAYTKQNPIVQEMKWEQERIFLEKNMEMIEAEIQNHPEVDYTIVFPPYSMLWWDSAYVNGLEELYFEVLERALNGLCSYENVKVHYFQHERDIICDLDNYMDMIHYGPWINQYMLEKILTGENLVEKETVSQVIQSMRDTYEYIINQGIYQYYTQ